MDSGTPLSLESSADRYVPEDRSLYVHRASECRSIAAFDFGTSCGVGLASIIDKLACRARICQPAADCTRPPPQPKKSRLRKTTACAFAGVRQAKPIAAMHWRTYIIFQLADHFRRALSSSSGVRASGERKSTKPSAAFNPPCETRARTSRFMLVETDFLKTTRIPVRVVANAVPPDSPMTPVAPMNLQRRKCHPPVIGRQILRERCFAASSGAISRQPRPGPRGKACSVVHEGTAAVVRWV